MDGAVMRSAETAQGARENCERLLQETRDERTVLCADWHLCRFYDRDNPNWGRIYEWLIERALEMGAWVGPPGAFYEALPHPDGTVTDALQNLGATRQIHV
jgi:hypothetical protein